MPLIVALADAGKADRTLVGAKAKQLGKLLAAGTNVPDGFVITTEARSLSPDGGVPVEVRDALADALADFVGPAAYRSSAVAEDLGHASYAGQYESVLGVEGLKSGLAALQRCWASTATDAVAEYRSGHGDDDDRIAVIVQKMVPATAAGVTFTANPVTGGGETVIEATTGVGEALMAGDVTPARWLVTDAPRLESEGEAGPVLTDAQAASIAAECRSIAETAGEPRDIEWALEGDRLHILQARPITALPVEPTVDPPPKQTWLRDDAYFPAPITPLAFSAWLPNHSRAFSRVTAHYGLPFDGIDHRHWYGRAYNRVLPLGGIEKDHPLPPLLILKLAVRLAPPFRKRLAIAAQAAAEDRPMAAIDAWENGGRDALRSRTRELRLVDRAAMSDDLLADHLTGVMNQVLAAGIEHFMLSFAGMFIIAGQLGMLMEELLGWPPERILDLVQGHGAASVAHGAELDELAAQIAADPEARRLAQSDLLAVADHLGPGGAALRDFLDLHGHRLISVDLAASTWAEDPSPLLRMVVARFDHTSDTTDPLKLAHTAETEALAAIADPIDRERFAHALERARLARPYGDESETDVGDILAVVRYIALDTARRLVEAGRLAAEEEVFLLTVDELEAALREATVPADLDRRRAEHRWALANPSPARFGPEPGEPPSPAAFPAKARPIASAAMWTLRLFQPPPPPPDHDGVRGLAASPGRVTGPARIIHSPAEFDRVRPGDIMVCPHTMASWSPIFPILGGLVTEHGGPLSHPGTLAREYGLPAVLAVTDATTLFNDGQLITINGATGRIETTT